MAPEDHNTAAASEWTVDTLHSQLSSQLEERSAHWEQMFRHADAMLEAADKRYEQRFDAQQLAMNLAIESIEKHLACIPSVVELTERVEGLTTKVSNIESRLVERVQIAFDGHAALHAAHDTAHNQEHEQNQQAITRAEITMRETAALHAVSHEREHALAKEAVDKAHAADAIRFESLNEAKARSQDERATFATGDQLDDKTQALAARIEVLDKQAAGASDRNAVMQANTARIEALEKELATTHGRDRGVSLLWGVAATAIGVAATIIGIALALSR